MKTPSAGRAAPPLKNAVYFDSANIAESYAGLVLPLTCSFARRVYEQVYFDFLRMSGVPRRQLRQNADVFKNLLGFFYGRMYYNMNNWYRLAQFVPGYRRNKANFETMITSHLQQEITCTITPGPLLKIFYPLILSTKFLAFDLTSWRFKHYAQSAIKRLRETDIEHFTLDECKNLFTFLEAGLLHRWYVTLENDFFVMTYLGLMRKFIGDNRLPQMIAFKSKATQQVAALASLSQAFQKNAGLWRAIRHNQENIFNQELAGHPALQEKLRRYLETFGGRFANELKLETVDLDQDMTKLFRVLETYATYRAPEAKNTARPETALPLPKRLLFLYLRRKFIKYSSRREEFRLLRSNMFSLNRHLFTRLGQIFSSQQHLEQPADIFYLTVEEILAFTPGQTAPALSVQVTRRKKAYQTYAGKNPPAHFITTSNTIPDSDNQTVSPNLITAQGVSPGVVRGKVRVMKTFTLPQKIDFDILVTQHTDPGWTSLIALCRGLIIEHGGVLSHASIIARELGIPAIIGVANATDLFADGQIITLNGSDGTIKHN